MPLPAPITMTDTNVSHVRGRTSLPIASLQGGVHRFSGVVDRFGSFPRGAESEFTLCVRELQLAETGQPLDCDHWWFRLREVWIDAGVRMGDVVEFTARVQRCSKGWADPGQIRGRRRDQVLGLGSAPQDVRVQRRRRSRSRQLGNLQAETQELRQCLQQRHAHLNQLQEQRDGLLQDNTHLQRALTDQQMGLSQERSLGQQLRRQLTRHRRRLLATSLAALACGMAGGLSLGTKAEHASRQATSQITPSVVR